MSRTVQTDAGPVLKGGRDHAEAWLEVLLSTEVTEGAARELEASGAISGRVLCDYLMWLGVQP